MSDLDINKKRLELINLTFDELVEFCLDLLIQRNVDHDVHLEDVNMAHDIGYEKGYRSGRQDEIDERRY